MEVPIQQPLLPREFYKIGEVAASLGVPPSAVRFWKDQFPAHVRPRRSATQHLVFSRRDVVVLALVRHLVHELKLPLKTPPLLLKKLLLPLTRLLLTPLLLSKKQFTTKTLKAHRPVGLYCFIDPASTEPERLNMKKPAG